MTVRSFWLILLKIIGIWIIVHGLFLAFEYYSTQLIPFSDERPDNVLLALIMVAGLYALVFYFFILKTSWLVDILKLEQDIPDRTIGINASRSDLISLAIIVIGGVVFVDGFIYLFQELYTWFQLKFIFDQPVGFQWAFFYFVKAAIGYLLITNSRAIVSYIEKPETPEQDETV